MYVVMSTDNQIGFVNTDRCNLQNVSAVEMCQEQLLECILYLFQKNHSNDSLLFAKVVASLVELRTMAAEFDKAEETFAREWSDKVEFSAIMYEMWFSCDVSRQIVHKI